jgi:DNA-binding beta-propeller fold protein YncE
VSADGNSVYVTSFFNSDSISHFTRADDGSLMFQACIDEVAGGDCSTPAGAALDGPAGVAVSADGNSVYVAAAATSEAINHFTRADDGSLTFQACFDEFAGGDCSTPAGASLTNAAGVDVSDNGKSTYVTSLSDDAINHFTRAADGSLTFQACIDEVAGGDCSTPPGIALNGALDVDASPDGTSVYVVSFSVSNSISHFTRAADGSLTFQACIDETAGGVCSTPAGLSLDAPTGIAISEDGKSVYAASNTSSSLSHFARAADGSLTFATCIDHTAGGDCSTPAGIALDGAFDVAATADNRSIYVVATTAASVSHFDRELPSCRGRAVTAFGRAGPETIVGTAGPDTIAGLGGNDTIRGMGGRDRLCGGAGGDRLIGGKGGDSLLGGAGRDLLRGGGGRDRLLGKGGRDRLIGGPKRDVCRGGAGRDIQRAC